MASQVVGVSPKDLVMLTYREVVADDTMDQFRQVFRFDLVDVRGQALRVQVLWDRRHKLDKSLSRPLGYFPMGSTSQLIGLANTGLACAMVLAYNERGRLEPSRDEVMKALDGFWELNRVDVESAVETVLRDLRLHRMAQAKLSDLEVQAT